MPTLITHAKPPGPHCQQALSTLPLPRLDALLGLLSAGARQSGEDDSLSPLHELLQAQALGLTGTDGLLPWAALQAQALQRPQLPAQQGWAWLTPCHWQANADHVRMADPADSHISDAESQQVMQALGAFLDEDGIALHGLHAGNWLASGTPFKDLPTASLARAAGGAVDHWLPRQDQAQGLRRLQNEMQMLLYNHPVNEARTARGLLPINSFWVSGTGTLPAHVHSAGATQVQDALGAPALRDDAAAWTAAWQALDSGPIQALWEQARRGEPVTLTLCGQTAAQTFTLQPRSLWARLQQQWQQRRGTRSVAALLQSL